MPQLNTTEWIEILQNPEIVKEINIKIFQILYSFENKEAPSSEIGRILGKKGKRPAGSINLEIGIFANKIAKFYDIYFTERTNKKYKFWDLFFTGRDIKTKFYWKLKPEIIEALEATHLTGEIQYAEEIPIDENLKLKEGAKRTITVNSYERNSKARELCIDYWKPVCSVCEFDFEENYGIIGKGFIHIHHLIPIHEIGELYEIDPIKDLRPVCPNCHAMLHKINPPLEIAELKEKIEKNRL